MKSHKSPSNSPPLEESVELLLKRAKHVSLTIGEIVDILSGKGRALILLFLSLPFCQPLQLPGLSTPFGLVIAFLGLRIACGKRAWLPRRLLTKKITSQTLQKIAHHTLAVIGKVRRFIHPRLDVLCHHPAADIFHGIAIFLLGLVLALPLPIPFSNLVVAWSIFLISLGLLENDGLFIILGYLMALGALLVLLFAIFQINALL